MSANVKVRVGDKAGVAGEQSPVTYVWFDLADGSTLQVFYNDETRLFVADIINADEQGGIEFVRKTVPNA